MAINSIILREDNEVCKRTIAKNPAQGVSTRIEDPSIAVLNLVVPDRLLRSNDR